MTASPPIPYRNILVIQTGFVGDMVLTTPLLRSLRLHAPEAAITLLHDPRTRGIVRRCHRVDRRVVLEKRGNGRSAAGTLRIARTLREKRFDLVISPHRSIRSGLIALATGAGRRIGFDQPPAALFYTDPVPYSRWESTFVRRKLRLLEPIGIREEEGSPELYYSDEDEHGAAALLEEARITPPFAVLALGSAWPTKRWPAERFGELSRLLEERGIASLFVGSGADTGAAEIALREGTGADLTGMAGFEVLGPIIERAALFVGNDSGTLHLARAARVPAIGIFGPTGPEQFRFEPRVRVVRSNADCAPCSDHGSTECPLRNWICLPGISAPMIAGVADRLLEEEGPGDG